MRITPQAKLETERAILACAKRLFARKGVDATQTREIAASAKIAVGTLFNYFPTKEALAIAIASEAFKEGRETALRRIEDEADTASSVETSLFTLVACDIRALEPIRAFMGDVLEAGLTPFGSMERSSGTAAAIRAERIGDAVAVLEYHGHAGSVTPSLMHLFWSLYLGVLSFWTGDESPRQEDTWALLDQGMKMFVGSLAGATRGGGEQESQSQAAEEQLLSGGKENDQ